MRLFFLAIIPFLLFAEENSKVPDFARSNFKKNQMAVLRGNLNDQPKFYLTKVFGFVSDNESEEELLVLQFYEDPYKGKIFSGYKQSKLRKLYTSLEKLSDLKAYDPVVTTLSTGEVTPAIVKGLYYGEDGHPRYLLRFVGGSVDGQYGFEWTRDNLNSLKKLHEGPLLSESYVSIPANTVWILVGEVDSNRVLLRSIEKEEYKIALKEEVKVIRTHDHIPLMLPGESKEKPEATIEPIEVE